MTTSDRVPDGIEPIVGFRMWSYTLRRFEARLDPLRKTGDAWLPSPWDGAEGGWVEAECLVDAMMGSNRSHPAPAEDCSCGFYAMKHLEMLPVLGVQVFDEEGVRGGTILGRVQLAGTIIEHDFGYRAERARIVELIPIEGHEADGVRLASLLDLPLGHPVTAHPLPHLPPRGPSTVRLRVSQWVQEVAA